MEYLAVVIWRVASEEHIYSLSPESKMQDPSRTRDFMLNRVYTGVMAVLGILPQLSSGCRWCSSALTAEHDWQLKRSIFSPFCLSSSSAWLATWFDSLLDLINLLTVSPRRNSFPLNGDSLLVRMEVSNGAFTKQLSSAGSEISPFWAASKDLAEEKKKKAAKKQKAPYNNWKY